jgi:ribosomal protein S18 acetylase RimI-like enzyme
MTISVRRATAVDAELVSALNADVQAIHAAAMPFRFKPPGPDTFPPAEAAALLARPDHHVFIAEVDSEPAGYACAEVVRRAETTFHFPHEMIYLHHISVRPQYRRRGVGGALIAAARAVGQEAGITLLAAEVWTFNEAARAFFRRHGLTPYSERLWDR